MILKDLLILKPIPLEDLKIGKIFYQKSMTSIIFGYGSQGDRFLINQTASNGILYALSSSGILGVIIFFTFSILSFWILLKNFLKV